MVSWLWMDSEWGWGLVGLAREVGRGGAYQRERWLARGTRGGWRVGRGRL